MSINAGIHTIVSEVMTCLPKMVTPAVEPLIAETVAKDVFSPSGISKIVRSLPESSVCGEFKTRVMQSAERMMSHLDQMFPELSNYLRKSGFEILPVANGAEYHQLLLKAPLQTEELALARQEVTNLLRCGMPEAVQQEVSIIRIVTKEYPADSEIRQLADEIIHQLEAGADKGMLVEQYARLSRSLARPLQGPTYCDVLKKVIFPAHLPALPAGCMEEEVLTRLYGKLKEDPNLDRVMWHETRHYVDDVLGMQANKIRFSEEAGFRQVLQDVDLKRARSASILPPPETVTELGSELGNYLPLEGATPGVFSEAFAELGFCPEKGGAVQTGLMRSVCPDTITYIGNQIREALKKLG